MKPRAKLYRIDYVDGRCYFGIIWKKDKTVDERLKEHLSGKGSAFIRQLINDGASLSDFKIVQIDEGDLDEIRNKEVELNANNLWPKGLNGNTSHAIVLSSEGLSSMRAKQLGNKYGSGNKGRSKETCSGVRRQAEKVKLQKGEKRTEAQREWDSRKSDVISSRMQDGTWKKPPDCNGRKFVYKPGEGRKLIKPEEVELFLSKGWLLGQGQKPPVSEETKEKLRKPRPLITCPHCGKTGGNSLMKRWHFGNCKNKRTDQGNG